LREQEIKQHLRKSILSRLSSVPGVLSVTLVGSFNDRDDMTGISDIDTVVICDQLNLEIFNKCLEKAQSIPLEECGLKRFRLKSNTSFGPLKFDEPKLAVLHLMIYDVEGHRRHVIASPFTCLDWERSKCLVGKSLKDVFPVGRLQPRDFLEARRGLGNYLEDLRIGTISIRDYEFGRNSVSEVRRTHPLDARHRGEYAFHIVRNLVLNGMKLKYSENRLYPIQELEIGMDELLDGVSSKHLDNFRHLIRLKEQRSKAFPEWTLGWAEGFVADFQQAFLSRWQDARSIYFMRHAPTSLNDGTFLGRGRDPGILEYDPASMSDMGTKTIYSSPARRCLETAVALVPELQPFIDERLHEINYASAEGLTYEKLRELHPGIIQAWSNGKDPNFPDGGENISDVQSRLQNFIVELIEKKGGATVVMTHNVVLRCLIGKSHSIPQQDWHSLSIPHAEPLEFKILDGKLYSNITRTQLGKIFYGLKKI
jgi:broad specificity phosphatase PhoE